MTDRDSATSVGESVDNKGSWVQPMLRSPEHERSLAGNPWRDVIEEAGNVFAERDEIHRWTIIRGALARGQAACGD